MKNSLDDGITGTRCQAGNLNEDSWADLGDGLASSGHRKGSRGRGRGRSRTRTRGGRSQRKVIGSRGETTKQNDGILGQGLGWKGHQRGGGRKRGRRTIRRQKPAKRVFDTGVVENTLEENINEKPPRSLVQDWNAEDATSLQLEDAEPASSSGRSEYDEENGQESGDEYDDMAMGDYATGFNGRPGDLDGSDYNVDGIEDEVDEDDDDQEYDVGQDEQGDFDVDRYLIGDSDEEENRGGDGKQNMELDQPMGYSSSDYSD